MKSSTRIASRALAVAASAGAVALAAAIPGASARPALALTAARTASAAVPRCATSSLEVWLGLGLGSVAGGSSYYPLEFSNVSTHSCTLHGYPGVSAIGSNGTQLGSAAGWNPTVRPRTVTLTPGATVHTVLRIADVSNYPPIACKPATAIALRIYPPNQTRATEVPFTFGSCSAKGPMYLGVEATQPNVGIPGRL
jgi:hypothetical protein